MILAPTVVDHIYGIKLDGPALDEQIMVLDAIEGLPNIDEVLELYGRTLLVDDRPIASFGVWPMWKGVGRAWSLISLEATRQYPKSLYKAVSRCLSAIEERDKLRRIEATIRYGHLVAHGWIRKLGFKDPFLMKNYGIGGVGDYYLYQRLKE